MGGLGDFFLKIDPKRIQQMLLVLAAVLILAYFISFWPRHIFLLKKRLPHEISMRWFLSFPGYQEQHLIVLSEDRDFFNKLALLALFGHQDYLQQRGIDQCIEYYGILQQTAPDLDSARLVKGFCEYYKGKEQEAQKDLMAVFQQKQDLFWAQYDLGILSIKDQEYDRARYYFDKALRIPTGVVLKEMLTSSVYLKLMAIHGITISQLMGGLERAREESILLEKRLRHSSDNINWDEINKSGSFITFL